MPQLKQYRSRAKQISVKSLALKATLLTMLALPQAQAACLSSDAVNQQQRNHSKPGNCKAVAKQYGKLSVSNHDIRSHEGQFLRLNRVETVSGGEQSNSLELENVGLQNNPVVRLKSVDLAGAKAPVKHEFSAVPLPIATWLLLGSFIGVLGWRKTRKID